ncbi:MAG: hypothetical protein JXK05_00330 [Campylobacterales bacterium]|nr:hypothetical protein [Campylobacterales bacterium]
MLVALMLTSPVRADFYVIPVSKKVKNVVTVAKSGGDYTDIQQAIDSISGASESNPYLIYIGPGTYYPGNQIVMKPYVSMSGSGEGVTIVTGTKSDESSFGAHSIIKGASNTTLSHLTVQNFDVNNNFSSALFLNGINMQVKNVFAKVIGTCSTNAAILAMDDAGSKFENVTTEAIGMNDGSNIGLYVIQADNGVYLENVTLYAANGSSNYGLKGDSDAKIIVRRSTLDAEDYGVNMTSGSAYISQSSIVRRVTGAGTIKCAACDDGSGNEVEVTCNNEVNGGL